MEHTVTLDKASFKALALESRVDILKTLQGRQHTQTELAEALELSVPTIKQHLDALVNASLVERRDEGRKWVYYALTKKGKAILNPEEAKFWIVLGTLALTVGGAITGFFRSRFADMYAPTLGAAKEAAVQNAAEAAPRLMAAPVPAAADQGAQALQAMQATNISPTGAAAGTQVPWGWITLGIVVLAQLGLLGYFWMRTRKQKKEWETLGIKRR
jgi:DNA-binding transcriptional ArsR family regulator